MAGSPIRDKIEQNVTIWLLSTLLTGFLAGIGVYRAIQDMAGLKILSAADLEGSKQKLAELSQKLETAENHAAALEAQVKQAYWAVRGTQVTVIYPESSARAAVDVTERLAGAGALVTLRPLDRGDPERTGLYYESGGRDAAMQIKALASDIAPLSPEDAVDIKPETVALWLAEQ